MKLEQKMAAMKKGIQELEQGRLESEKEAIERSELIT